MNVDIQRLWNVSILPWKSQNFEQKFFQSGSKLNKVWSCTLIFQVRAVPERDCPYQRQTFQQPERLKRFLDSDNVLPRVVWWRLPPSCPNFISYKWQQSSLGLLNNQKILTNFSLGVKPFIYRRFIKVMERLCKCSFLETYFNTMMFDRIWLEFIYLRGNISA